MTAHRPQSVARRARLPRRGFSWIGLLVTLVLVGAGSYAAWAYLPWGATNSEQSQIITHPVSRGQFVYLVTEQGEIESSSNVEVRCEVQARNSAGTAILQLVPEGTYVNAGDMVAVLDKSALEAELNQQQIVCNSTQAAVIQAESTLQTANIAKQEYLDGTFRQEEQVLLGEISVAEENLRRAEDYAIYSEKLAGKGYVTQLQLEADRFAVEKARMDLATAKTKIDVLRNFTRAKMVSQLDADIKIAEANLASQESSHKLDLEKLALIKAQVDKCEIRAPSSGQVVYANDSDRRGDTEILIEEGAVVRERQVIARLPDPKKMQVRAKINEARVDRIRTGLPVVIKLDAFPALDVRGTVRRVDEYPLPTSWYGGNVKEYGAYIDVLQPPEGIRPGMTAEVRIEVARFPDALQVPVQAVVERGGQHFCLVRSGVKIEAREVKIGTNNEKFVVIQDGLGESELVLLSPRNFLDQVDLPDATTLTETREMLAQNDAESTGAEDDSAQSGETVSAEPAAATSDEQASDQQQPRQGGNRLAGVDPQQAAGMMLEQFDKDHDGRLSQDELPERMQANFARSDRNGDGFLDASEMSSIIKRLAATRSAGGAGSGPPAGGAGL